MQRVLFEWALGYAVAELCQRSFKFKELQERSLFQTFVSKWHETISIYSLYALSWIPGGIRAMIVNWNTSSYSLTISNQTTPSQKYKKHLTLARNANFARHCFMNCPMEKFFTTLVVYARSLIIIYMIKTTSYAILQSPSFAIATFIWVKPYHMSKNTIRC